MSSPQIFAILPTFRRQSLLSSTLQQVFAQSRPPDNLLVVDNEGSSETEALVAAFSAAGESIDYLAAPTNLGSAGGWALGMERILELADDDDWVLPLDDDDPPQAERDLEQILAFAQQQRDVVDRLAGVGIVGARFDWRRGYVDRLADEELCGAVPVDYLGSNHLPLYSAGVMRREGVFRSELFFGHTEIEYCLRLGRSGYEFRCHGELWRGRRVRAGNLGVTRQRSILCEINWRRYYVTRNYIFMMRQFRRYDLAIKRAVIQSIAKPLVTLFRSPSRAVRGFSLGLRATIDGFTGRMGKVIDPATFQNWS